MKLSKEEKYKILVDEFKKRDHRTLDVYDEVLLEKLGGISPKTLQRLIEEFMLKYNSVVEVPKQRRKTYKLATPIDVVVESFEHFDNIGWLFAMAHDSDPKLFEDLEEYIQKDKHIYKFKNTPFEDINTLESNANFKRLKNIIQARDYAKLTFFYDDTEYDNLKCIKLVFVDGNWYVAFVDNEDKLRFGRISFIKRVDYASKIGHFQPSSISKHLEFLENFQNSMSLYGVAPQTALIQATSPVAKYFKKDMKKFLSTQKFVEEKTDGSILFTLEYTQELEILPFIQKWLPDLVILEPQELKEIYKKKLQTALKNY